MPLVPFAQLLEDARNNHYTVGAFNVLNMETIQAVVTAAEETQSPVILSTYYPHVQWAGADYLQAVASVAATHTQVPISINLDHGPNYDAAIECLNAGYTGIMIDLAHADYDQNVETTRKVVAIAHERGISVEAELGKIFDASEPVEVRKSAMTDPEMARRFAIDTGIDALAVSIGTAHGIYSSDPEIDFELLEKIIKMTECPIVVHGGSNIPDSDLVRIAQLGVAKINIGTDLMMAFNRGMYEILKDNQGSATETVLGNGRKHVIEVTKHKMKLLNTFKKVK